MDVSSALLVLKFSTQQHPEYYDSVLCTLLYPIFQEIEIPYLPTQKLHDRTTEDISGASGNTE
jgi:hypothetical protein